MKKLKISSLLKETGAFILTYNQGLLYTKEGGLVKNESKQSKFSKLLKNFENEKRMFKYLSDAKKYLNSDGPSVGFFIKEKNKDVIEVTRSYFIIGIATSLFPMGNVNYMLFFDEFIDLEGRKIIVNVP